MNSECETQINKLSPWEVLQEHDEINNKWLRIRNVTYRLPNGQELKDYYIAEKNPVAVVIPIKDGKTYLIQKYERGVEEIGHKFSAGRVGPEETIEEAANREFGEELGLKTEKMIYLGESYVDPGFMTTRAYFFLVLQPEETEEGKQDNPFELFKGEWVGFSKVGEMIAENEIKNPFVIVGYTLAQNYLSKHEKEVGGSEEYSL